MVDGADHIEAWPHAAPAVGALHQAVAAKALPTDAAVLHLHRILPAARTAHSAGWADQVHLALRAGDAIGIQVAATLAHAAG